MINSTEVIIPTLVNFSTFGFLIILGIAAFVPMVYDLMLNKKSTSVNRVQFYPIRLISRLVTTYSISYLLVLSFAFVLVGLSGLLYFLIGSEIFLIVALYLSIAILILFLIFIVYITISAIHYNRDEINEIVEFMNSTK